MEDHQGRRSGTSRCEAKTAVGVSEDESTKDWKEEEIGGNAYWSHLTISKG